MSWGSKREFGTGKSARRFCDVRDCLRRAMNYVMVGYQKGGDRYYRRCRTHMATLKENTPSVELIIMTKTAWLEQVEGKHPDACNTTAPGRKRR